MDRPKLFPSSPSTPITSQLKPTSVSDIFVLHCRSLDEAHHHFIPKTSQSQTKDTKSHLRQTKPSLYLSFPQRIITIQPQPNRCALRPTSICLTVSSFVTTRLLASQIPWGTQKRDYRKMVSTAGGIVIAIIVLLVTGAVGWVIFTQLRARRLGVCQSLRSQSCHSN